MGVETIAMRSVQAVMREGKCWSTSEMVFLSCSMFIDRQDRTEAEVASEKVVYVDLATCDSRGLQENIMQCDHSFA